MLASLRWIAPLTVLGMIALALVVAEPTWLRSASAEQHVFLIQAPGEQVQIVQARMTAKSRVVDRLLAGELTLLEAAAYFRELNDKPSNYPCAYRLAWPGDSDGEKLCRQVIEWATSRCKVTRTPSERDEITRRLENELDRLLCQGGPVELPW